MKKKKVIIERPLDPSRNASDIMGDPSGQTGWTIGTGEATSAEPTEEQVSIENLPGGIIEHPTHISDYGTPREATSSKEYKKNVWKAMSQEKGAVSDDIASEAEEFISVTDMINEIAQGLRNSQDKYDENRLREEVTGVISAKSNIVNTSSAPFVNSENTGEQEFSGSTPDPSSDDDQLANVQAMGGQQGEDAEHPKELNANVDNAEEEVKNH